MRPVAVGGEPEHEAAGRQELLERVVGADAVELAGLAADVDRPVLRHRDALGVVEAVREHLELIDGNQRCHIHPFSTLSRS